MNAVDIRDAFRIHRSPGGTAVALQGLSLEVDEGEIVVVLGPSGSGKTTLLRVVAGFDTLSAGTAHVLGEDVGRLSPGALARFRAANLGVLDQHYARALSPDLSSVQTVALGPELVGSARPKARDAAAKLLERVGLGDRLVHVRDGRVVEEGAPGRPASLVVTEPGWIRLPDPLLEALGSPRQLRAELQGEGILLNSPTGAPAPPAELAALAARPAGKGEARAEVRDVVKRFPGARREVLDGLSWRFDAGIFTAVVGRSGSGKTTLLHLLAGLERQTAGEVLVSGHELGVLGRAEVAALRCREIALVTQEPGLVPHLTARENVELGLQVRGALDGADRTGADALVHVGLADRLDHRADRLSAGERQRVAIARALATRPRILLADEPTARLDQQNAKAIGRLLARLTREHETAIICATHDTALIEEADAELSLAAAEKGHPRVGLTRLAGRD